MYRARAALERKDSSQNARAVDPERESGWVQYIFFLVPLSLHILPLGPASRWLTTFLAGPGGMRALFSFSFSVSFIRERSSPLFERFTVYSRIKLWVQPWVLKKKSVKERRIHPSSFIILRENSRNYDCSGKPFLFLSYTRYSMTNLFIEMFYWRNPHNLFSLA